ncbi:PLAC8 family-domain-containing protein [Cyathus striatus]|nr:PLAC8 family-domain-containing protein [Cyathus striatus]
MSYQDKQPQPVQPMSIEGGNKNAKNLPVGPDGKRDWSFGLFGCCGDMGACCLGTWCPCLLHARNKRRLEHLNTQGTPHPNRHDVCNGDSCVYGLIEVAFDMGWILQIGTRGAIRERYQIRGSTGSDCMAAMCCGICDLVQGHRELELEENSFSGQA